MYSEIKKLGKVEVIFVELISKDTMVHEREMAEEDAAGVGDKREDFLRRVDRYQVVSKLERLPKEEEEGKCQNKIR